jgi:hypothetical protein
MIWSRPASDDVTPMPTAMLRTLAGRQVWVGTGSLLSRTHFYYTGNKCFVVPPAPFTLRGATDERLIYFNRPLTANGFSSWTNHSGTQFVKNAERRLVAFDPEHLLKLERRHSGSKRCDKESAPKPRAKRHLAVLHDSTSGQPSVSSTAPASQHLWPSFETKCFTCPAAVGT